VKTMLQKEGPQKVHLQQFLEAWNTAEKGE
jgi:hypothetical protein